MVKTTHMIQKMFTPQMLWWCLQYLTWQLRRKMATLNWVCKDFVFFSCRARLDHLRWRVNLSARRYLIALSPFLWLNPTKFHPFFDWVCNLFPSERSPLAWKYPSQATHPHAHPAPPYPSTYPPTLLPRTPAYPHHRLYSHRCGIFLDPTFTFSQAPRDISYSCLALSWFAEVDPSLIFNLPPFKVVSRWRKVEGVDTDKLKLMATSFT